ncbi:hypothetical protein LCGC14_2528110, partial [marine sediment metagenome]
RALYLFNNQLTPLSNEFCEALERLTQLGWLSLSNNQLKSLSNEFCKALVKLTQLEGRLHISNNFIFIIRIFKELLEM